MMIASANSTTLLARTRTSQHPKDPSSFMTG
jgi:hypothetical protein